ncbi:aldehyde ferredoxin oxidoreductase [Candidatus Thorarchaeota archaeon]|nr:MAG: aldehyde ferredoxin oxidoreductase [Candidatus Thorarchaeota archaeon]
MSKILRVNMNDMDYKWEEVPKKYSTYAGRAMTTAIVHDEVEATCDPLRENNKVVVSPGLLAGTPAPSSGRISFGGKSPLTGTIKEANAGGLSGTRLGNLGIRAIVIEGMPETKKDWYSLYVSKDDVELLKTNDYAGIGLYDLIGRVWKKYDTRPGIVGCGVAGQRKNKSAGIFGNNIENTDPGRYAGRGGLGAVLGSKRLVAIISDDKGADRPKPKDKDLFDEGRKKLAEALDEHPVTGKLEDDDGNPYGGLKNYGTNVLMNILNEAGGLPSRGFSSGRFNGASKISGEAVHELVDKTKKKFGDKAEGMYGHPCHPGCIMACSNVVPYEKTGKAHVSPLEYESAWSLGTNLVIDNLEHVAELNRLCNDLGLDTIEAGNTIAMFMESGQIDYGDGEAAIKLLKEAYKEDSVVGKLISSGAKIAGETFGVTRIPVVKGQSLPAYDPRPIRGIGVTYATSTMGADHTSGYTIAAEILGIKGDVSDPREMKKAELSRNFQATTAYIDSSGYCLFIAFAILDIDKGFEGMTQTVNGFLGDEVDVTKYGLKVLEMERDFNRNAGFTKEDDRLPEFFRTEPLPPHDVTFDVPDDELDAVYKDM